MTFIKLELLYIHISQENVGGTHSIMVYITRKFLRLVSQRNSSLVKKYFCFLVEYIIVLVLAVNKSSDPDQGSISFRKAINSLPTECRLLITFAYKLDPDQARQNVGPDLDPICLTLRWYS